MYTPVINMENPLARLAVVVDGEGNPISKVIEYNLETKEAEVYVMNEDGTVRLEWQDPGNTSLLNGGIRKTVTERVILTGSKLMFKIPTGGHRA